jgi:hypothetical protein
MDGSGIEFRLGRGIFAPVQTEYGAHTVSYTMGIGLFPEVKRPGVALTNHSRFALRSRKE